MQEFSYRLGIILGIEHRYGMLVLSSTYHKIYEKGTVFKNPFAEKVYDSIIKKCKDYCIDREIDDDLGEMNLVFFNDEEVSAETERNIRKRNVYLIHQFLDEEGKYDPKRGPCVKRIKTSCTATSPL